jgi:hypothetical protein
MNKWTCLLIIETSVIRRLVMMITLVFWYEYPVYQLALNVFLTLGMLFMHFIYKPANEIKGFSNTFSIMREVLNLILLYHLFCHADMLNPAFDLTTSVMRYLSY